MTSEELHTLEEIAFYTKGWEVHKRLQEFMKTVEVQSVEDEGKGTSTGQIEGNKRTLNQNSALHLWFKQIAEACQGDGVTMNLIISHTHDVQVTEYGVKALWHVLQKALYGTESTTELKKVGQIERMIDHFAALFGKEGVELPPFPNDETKNNIKLAQMENLKREEYPEYSGKTSFE